MSLILILFIGVKSIDDNKVKMQAAKYRCEEPDTFKKDGFDNKHEINGNSFGSIEFTYCKDIESISFTIYGSVPKYYFAHSNVKHVTLDESLTTINEGAFAFCENLGEITLPDSLELIGRYAFFKSNIKTISSNALQNININEAAFYHCSQLETNAILGNIRTVGISSFEGCSNMKGELSIYGTGSNDNIGKRAFYECSKITGLIRFPDSLTAINDYSFYKCSGLNSYLVLPTSLKTICDYSFSGCSGLIGSIIIPNSVTEIGDYAFSECSGFTGSIEIPTTTKITIGRNVFLGCSNLPDLFIFPTNIEEISDDFYSNNKNIVGSLILPKTIKKIGKRAFLDCTEITGSLNLPPLLTSIDDEAFSGCSGLTGSLIIPDSVTEIGNRAFYGCTGFTGSLRFGKNMEKIGSFAFAQCSNFSDTLKFRIGDLDIGEYAFQNCTGFEGGELRFVVDSSLNSTELNFAIDTKAFENTNFKKVYYNGKFTPVCDVDIGIPNTKGIQAAPDYVDTHFCGNPLFDDILPEKKKGLSGGAIAGIVIACVVVAAGATVGIIFLLKAKGKIGNSEEP